jgi:hypothetical protein
VHPSPSSGTFARRSSGSDTFPLRISSRIDAGPSKYPRANRVLSVSLHEEKTGKV